MDLELSLIVGLNLLIAVIGWIQYREYRDKRRFHVRTTPDRRRDRPQCPTPTLHTVGDAMRRGVAK